MPAGKSSNSDKLVIHLSKVVTIPKDIKRITGNLDQALIIELNHSFQKERRFLLSPSTSLGHLGCCVAAASCSDARTSHLRLSQKSKTTQEQIHHLKLLNSAVSGDNEKRCVDASELRTVDFRSNEHACNEIRGPT